MYREISRQWIACLQAGRPECGYERPAIRNMTRFLLKTPEHTWGNPGRYSLPGCGGSTVAHPHLPCWWDDYRNLSSADGEALLNTQPYRHAAASYAEQRFMSNDLAVAALEHAGHPLAAPIRAAIAALSNVTRPSTRGFERLSDPSAAVKLSCGATVKIGADGSIASLKAASGSDWASPSKPLGAFVWRSYNESDWAPFTYNWVKGHKEVENFCKPGSNNFSEQANFFPRVTDVHVDKAGSAVIVSMAMPSRALKYGAPTTLTLSANLSASAAGDLRASLQLRWFGQTPTMIGVGAQVLFAPGPQLRRQSAENRSAWSLEKLGSSIDPENVIAGGNQWNHGVFRGVEATTAAGVMRIEALDTAIYNMMTREFPWGNALPAAYQRTPDMPASTGAGLPPLAPGSVFGVAAGLFNNLWNTNYPLWYPYYDPAYCADGPLSCSNQNQLFRFELALTAR